MLSEETYQNVFDWELVCSKGGVKVHHRIFCPLSGTDTLPYMAEILATQLSRFYVESNLFKREEWHTSTLKDDSSVQFSFEYPISSDLYASREGDLDKVKNSLFRDFGELHKYDRPVVDQLAIAEHCWQKTQVLKIFELGAIIVSYTNAVESWLNLELPGWNSKSERERGGAYKAVKSSHLWPLAGKVGELWRLRKKGVHRGPDLEPVAKNDVERARELTLDILCGRES